MGRLEDGIALLRRAPSNVNNQRDFIESHVRRFSPALYTRCVRKGITSTLAELERVQEDRQANANLGEDDFPVPSRPVHNDIEAFLDGGSRLFSARF